jgi:hypothetical protein
LAISLSLFDSLDHLWELSEHLVPVMGGSILQELEGLLGKSGHIRSAGGVMELGESELSGELAVSLGFGDVSSNVLDILKHLSEVGLSRLSLHDNVFGILNHVFDIFHARNDVSFTNTHGAVGLGLFNISHDVLDILEKGGEVWLARLDLGENVLGVLGNVLNISDAGSHVSSSNFLAQLAVSFSSLDISDNLLSILKDGGDIDFAGLGDLHDVLSSGDDTLNVFETLRHTFVSLSKDIDVLLLVVVAVLMDVLSDDSDDLNGSTIGGFPVASLGFVIDSVTDVTNSVPVRFALVMKLAGSLDPEDSVLELSGEVHNTFLVLVTNAGDETLESILHDPFSLVAVLWGWWLWMLIAVMLGLTEDLHHSVEGFLGMVPVTSLSVVESPFSDVLDVLHISSALTLKMAGILELWKFHDHVLELSFNSLLVLHLGGLEDLVNIGFEVLSILFAAIGSWLVGTVIVSLVEDLSHIVGIDISLVPVTLGNGLFHSLGKTIDHPEVLGTLTLEVAKLLHFWHMSNDVLQGSLKSFSIVSLDIIEHLLDVLHHGFDGSFALIVITFLDDPTEMVSLV